jgi:hypothetical protein
VIRGLRLLAATVLAACGPRPEAAGPESCGPSTATLPPGASASALEGEYRIRLVATSGPRAQQSADGTLHLSRRAPAAAEDSHRRRHVLVGSGDVQMEEVGGPPQDLTSRDPARPGIIGFDLPPLDDQPGPRVLLRLGTMANRQDAIRIEGPYTALRVREIREDGFSGDWTSGTPLPVAEGYFCTWRDTTSSR